VRRQPARGERIHHRPDDRRVLELRGGDIDLAASGLPAHRLELEITESVLLNDSVTTLATLHTLKRLGVR
jgi:EAL domain-containing protein (putative c-di-GMP-specific phosphodiesterase class I)